MSGDDTDPEDSQQTTDERPPGHRTAKPPTLTQVMGGRYRIGDTIGRGGMGEVRLAYDEQIGREVALKRIRGTEPTDRSVKRFLREARIQGRLEHPGIPAVHELGRDADDLPYFVMKRLAGTSLRAILEASERDPTHSRLRLLRAFADICLTVEFAHVNGVLHRDLKPDNIVFGEFGEVYVIDWGVAKLVGEDDDFDDIRGDELQTRAGAAVGTPGYMAPEQERGEADIDARADVYALGCLLGEILAQDSDPRPELVALRDRASAVERDERIQTARELGDAIQRYLDGDRDLALRQQLAAAHLERARAAFDAGNEQEHRSTAMREAGRALALAPTLVGAAELIGRLMLEPPRVMPPEAEQAMVADSAHRARKIMRGSLWGFVGYLALVPGLVTIGSLGYVVAMVMMLGLAFTATWLAGHHERHVHPLLIAVANSLVVVLIARMYSPLLIAPGIAAVIAMSFGDHPFMTGRAAIMLWLSVTMITLGPLVAEQLGLLSHTIEPSQGDWLLHGPALQAGPVGLAGGAVYVAALIAVAVLLSHVTRRTDHSLRRALHLQSWQLRQLAPDPQPGTR